MTIFSGKLYFLINVRLFQKRAEEIDEAMKKNHFDIINESAEKIKLLRMEYIGFEKSKKLFYIKFCIVFLTI